MKIIGYGICGAGEADRYMEATLKEFKRLCDKTIIVGNKITQKERDLITKYGFDLVEDDREWGVEQWRIKEDFAKTYLHKYEPDLCVCLDMDEVFDQDMTREDLEKLYGSRFEAFYFYITDLWGDGYSPAHSFWNIRAWKFLPEKGLEWPHKNLHCGLAPEWVWYHGFYSPHFVLHYGLKEKVDRQKKVDRYDKYDPKARFIAKTYYEDLSADIKPARLDLEKLRKEVRQYVIDTNQKYIVKKPHADAPKYVFVRKTNGQILDMPERTLLDTLNQHPDWEVIGNSDEI